MARKGRSTGPTEDRTEEEPWEPESDRSVNRTLDESVEIEIEEGDFAFIYGDIVNDADADDPEDLVVVNIPESTAEKWTYEGQTLSDRYPSCPPDDEVVVCVKKQVLDEYMPNWDSRKYDIPLAQLREDEIAFSAYPSIQLILVEESHLRE
ncbi:MAG: hypothetical protein U5J64_08245 [Halobacteriales archaeon]|nr:hypothetical protein [Halobacteriales archaeon]